MKIPVVSSRAASPAVVLIPGRSVETLSGLAAIAVARSAGQRPKLLRFRAGVCGTRGAESPKLYQINPLQTKLQSAGCAAGPGSERRYGRRHNLP
jgi:hypothetical protein